MSDFYISVRMRIHREGMHLSGAEDLVPHSDLNDILSSFSQKINQFVSSTSSQGIQQTISIDPIPIETIIKQPLLPVQSLTLEDQADSIPDLLTTLLEEILPIKSSQKILNIFFHQIMQDSPKNGAILVSTKGEILSSGQNDGVRTTHLGCSPHIRQALKHILEFHFEKPFHRFIDAIILASKVIASQKVLLEICASDDPLYTTGYMASNTFGYIRIPHIKQRGINRGGRIYIVQPDTSIHELLHYLKATPVLFTSQLTNNSVKAHPFLVKIPSIVDGAIPMEKVE